MWQACYLLDIEGLKATAAWEALLDQERLQKYRRIKNETVALQSLGAGLLLQLAAGEFPHCQKNQHNEGALHCEGKLAHEECLRAKLDSLNQQEIPMIFLDEASLQERLQAHCVLNLSYRYNAYGKPYFTNVPLYFSLSHSGSRILCACSEQEIGADLQKETGQNGKKISKRFFSRLENDYLNGITDEILAKETFFRLWTRKEAYGKLAGDGILKAADIPLLEKLENLYWQEGQFVSECGEVYYYSVCVKR